MIFRIHFNWRQIGNIRDGLRYEYDSYQVGERGVTKITAPSETTTVYIVQFEDGTSEVIYNPCNVYSKVKNVSV